MSARAKISDNQSGGSLDTIGQRRLKSGTKVRSKVETLFGTIRPGDVVTIIGHSGFGEDFYEVHALSGSSCTLSVRDFTVLGDSEA